MNNINDYLTWKKKVLTDLPDLITSADIVNIIPSNVKFVNMAIESHRIRSVPYLDKRVVAKQWLEEYLDTLQEFYDPIHDRIDFPEGSQMGKHMSIKKRRHTIDYSAYTSFEQLLEDFEDELTVQDIGHILGQHPDTVRNNLFKGRLRYKKSGVTYLVEKAWLLEYLTAKGIKYEDRLQGRDHKREERFDDVVRFCEYPKTIYEIMEYVGVTSKATARNYILKPLIKAKRIAFTCKKHDNNQKYIAI